VEVGLKIALDPANQEIIKEFKVNSELSMPWGKYQGKTIEELPSSYLKWLSEECDDDEIMEAAEEEYKWRELFPGEHK
jgi:uncharacterized protein (DUF3820 family)